MTTGLQQLESVDLQTLDEKGRPPKPSRLKTAAAMRGMYMDLIRDDELSAIGRTRTRAMKDGEPPYNQAALNASGQGSRANANFLVGHSLIQQACNGYNDMLTSVKDLMVIVTEFGEAQERIKNNRILTTELSRTIRKWPSFTARFMRMVDLFVTDGVGIAAFHDTRDFRFNSLGFGEFLIPRQTPASESDILYAIARKDTSVVELYGAIENEDAAIRSGWNPDAVRKAISRATTGSSNGEVGEYEKLQRQIKNQDAISQRQFPHIPILHGYIKEFDGSISYFQCEKNGDGEFLFQHPHKYKSAEEAFVFFCYGCGNGTYHSIRGLGNLIYALVNLHNRMLCQMADGAVLNSAMMLKAESAKALEEFSLQYFGPYSVISDGVEVIQRTIPDLTRTSLPLLQEVKMQMDQNASRFLAPSGGGDAYVNRINVEQQLEAAAAGDSGAVDLFYASWDRVMREMCRRIIQGPKSDPLVAEFHRRIEKAGVTKEVLDSIDHDSTFAFRAFGAGNPSARSLGFTRLLQLLPNLDEIGRKRLIYQFVADIVGYQNASYFTGEPEEDRLGDSAKIAELENILLLAGSAIGVNADEMHGTHAQIHVPAIEQIIEQFENGEADPMDYLPGLRAALQHLALHGDALAQDPTQRDIYGAVREVVNNMTQIVDNMERKIRAEQRKLADAGGQAAADGQMGPDAETAAKQRLAELQVQTAELKYQLQQQMGQLKLATEQAKAQQLLALNDIKGTEMVQKKLAFPGTSYQARRG